MNEPAEAHIAHDCPSEFDDLLFCVEPQEVIEHLLVDVVVIDEEPLRIPERRFLSIAKVLVAPRSNLRDRLFFQGFESP